MRDRRLWTEPNSLLSRVSPGRAGRERGWGGGHGAKRRVWDESQARDGSLAFQAPSLSSKARVLGRPWKPPLCPHPVCPFLRLPAGPGEMEARVQGLSFLVGTLGNRTWPLSPGLRRASQATLRGGGAAGLTAPGSRPRPSPRCSVVRGDGRCLVGGEGGSEHRDAPWVPGSHLGLRGPEGRGRPRGGPDGAQWFPDALSQELGRSGRGRPVHSLPSSCPPSAGGTPPGWSRRSSRAGNRRGLQSRDVGKEGGALGQEAPRRPGRMGRRDPSGPPLSVLSSCPRRRS